jgi:hypothetical protein
MNISIATIPPRINDGSLLKCIKSFENQTYPIKKIYVNLPKKFKRFEEMENLEKIIQDMSKLIKITRTNYDSPALKWLGFLPYVDDEDFVFIGDDDQEYHPELIYKMVEGIYNDNSVYQNRYHIVKTGTAGIIHGFVGAMCKKRLLNNLPNFNLPKICWIDDQLLSIYFHKQNIKIRPSPISDFDDIYFKLNQYDREQIGVGALCKMSLPRQKQIKQLEYKYNCYFQLKENPLSKGKIINVDWEELINKPLHIHFVCFTKINDEIRDRIKKVIKIYPKAFINLWDYKAINDPEKVKTSTLINYHTDEFGKSLLTKKGINIYIHKDRIIEDDFNIYEYLLEGKEEYYKNDMLELVIKEIL